MPTLFGRNWDKAGLLKQVGDVRQLGGAQPVVLDDGPERGVRAIDVRTGSGFLFTVLPDRGLDVWRAEYQGASLCWHSATGPTAPAFFEPEGFGFLRSFYGGMLVTCGLTYAGPPNTDQGKALGLHGRASNTPAYEVGVGQGWKGDEYEIEVRGKVREAAVFGEHVVLTRRVRTALGRNGFRLEDEAENLGHEPVPLMMLYHVNAGFPVVSAETQLLAPSREVRGVGDTAEKEKDIHAKFAPPQPGYAERCYFHRLRARKDGWTTVAVVNRGFRGGSGLGYALSFPVDALPCFTEWKMIGEGTYVVGTEPGNIFPEARERLRAEKRLPMLGPGEKKSFVLEFSVLASPEEIRAVEQDIRSMGT